MPTLKPEREFDHQFLREFRAEPPPKGEVGVVFEGRTFVYSLWDTEDREDFRRWAEWAWEQETDWDFFTSQWFGNCLWLKGHDDRDIRPANTLTESQP